MNKLKIHVDQRKCVGSGQCVRVAPEVFDQRESDGIVTLLNANPPPGLELHARNAARICPAQAIRVESSDAAPP